MKKLTLMLVSIIISFCSFSQTPQAFKYQAVVRNADGEIVANQNVSFEISIHDSIPTGGKVYQETHTVETNEFGLVSLEIGNGVSDPGQWSAIDWSKNDKFLEVALDINGGEEYISLGTTQLLAVPYALYSEKTGDSTRWRKMNNDLYYTEGKVGIGTNTPSVKLDLRSSVTDDHGRLWLGNSDLSHFLRLFSGRQNSPNPGILWNESDALRFGTSLNSWTEYMRITNTGYVGIGTQNPDPSAKLEISSNSQGFLPPRLTNLERDAISNPAIGLFIFNLDENAFQSYNGLVWQSLIIGSCVPLPPDTIFGELYPACNQSGMVYSIDEIPEATNYNWAVPTDATIVSGLGTPSIVVDFGILGGNVSAQVENGCGNSAFTDLYVTIGIPPVPSFIYGDTIVDCNTAGKVYSIDSILGTLNYNWTVPADAIITSGQGTTSIAVDFGTQSENVSVQAENVCGTSGFKDLYISIGIPANPDDIDGPMNVGCNVSRVYSTDAVAGANNYNWTVPSGASVTSGQGTTTITVLFGTSSGNISVRAENNCGNSSYEDLFVNVSTPGMAHTIYGEDTVCCYSELVTYLIDGVAGATDYVWTLPSDAMIESDHDNSIRVNFGTQSGIVSVNFNTNCGSQYLEMPVYVGWNVGCEYEGGIIVYITDTIPELHGIVCAPSDLSIGTDWGCDGIYITGANSTLDGEYNTNNIVQFCPVYGIAARVCSDAIINGYNDWFLPASDQLDSMYIKLHQFGLGGFSNDWYWNSTQENENNAWGQEFVDGYKDEQSKNNLFRVRAVREF